MSEPRTQGRFASMIGIAIAGIVLAAITGHREVNVVMAPSVIVALLWGASAMSDRLAEKTFDFQVATFWTTGVSVGVMIPFYVALNAILDRAGESSAVQVAVLCAAFVPFVVPLVLGSVEARAVDMWRRVRSRRKERAPERRALEAEGGMNAPSGEPVSVPLLVDDPEKKAAADRD